MTPSGEALPEHRQAYALNLADGMEAILKKKIGPQDRARIADAMKPLSWSRLVESLAKIYDRLLSQALSKAA